MATDWAHAWDRALYGPAGFYVSGPGARQGPAAHFRTSVHVGASFHQALADVLLGVDAALGHPRQLDLVDVGAGRGELTVGVLHALPPDVRCRVRALCLDVRSRPSSLADDIAWQEGVAPQSLWSARPGGVTGLILAHEWLDDVPCDVVQVDRRSRPRLVLVDDDGREHLGPAVADREGCAAYGVDGTVALRWLHRWWPVTLPGSRAEVGVSRDRAWAGLTAHLRAGTAVAIDYGHLRAERLAGRYDTGTLSAYAGHRHVTPVPDGRCDLTAHVAVDSCADVSNGGPDTVTLTRQRDALAALGPHGGLPDRECAVTDPGEYAAALERATQTAELRDRGGLGSFWWLRLDRVPALRATASPSVRSGPRPAPCSPARPGPAPAPAPARRRGAQPRP